MTPTDWPPLPFPEWESTCDTLHMWTQIVGKTRMMLTPMVNHYWNVALYVTPRGLSTSAIPYGAESFDAEFDLIGHRLSLRKSDGRAYTLPLFPRSVADFYAEFMASLQYLGIELKIDRTPVEFDDTTPFDQDEHHASYDREYVERFRRILMYSDQVLKEFRSRFVGKCSPVHFFWGSFDLAVTRFSGRPAPPREGMDAVTREAYSQEVSSCGFWPGDRRFPKPAFYAYSSPAPAGLEREPVSPAAARWDTTVGEFILEYDAVRSATRPEQSILDFCQSAYQAGAKLASWNRAELERQSK
jgi:hypothetical protein